MPKILAEKKKNNEEKIKQTESLISDMLKMSLEDPNLARKIFNTQLKQKQLPWTQEMFTDIEDFFHFVYREFILVSFSSKTEAPLKKSKISNSTFSKGEISQTEGFSFPK